MFHQIGESETHQRWSDRRKQVACGAIDYKSKRGCVVTGRISIRFHALANFFLEISSSVFTHTSKTLQKSFNISNHF